ncbi:keratin, type II cytoskeletal 8-like [Pholidichthys leucotaenia]
MSAWGYTNMNKRMYVSPVGFSSKSMGSYSIPQISTVPTIKNVTVNKKLLTPVKIGLDPTVQAVRTKEKEQIKSLNNCFASYIDKVRGLEQQNKILDTKWKLLQQQTAPASNVEPMLKAFIASLERQLDLLNKAKQMLDIENSAMYKHAEDFKTKYEDEVNRRTDAENEFVLLKKDMDAGYLSKVDLESNLSGLKDELNFLKALYDVELRELQESLKNISVVVEMDNTRDLNMDQIVSDVKAYYEDIAARSREEAESWYKNKFDQMAAESNQYENELRTTKGETAELKRLISRLQHEIEAAKAQRASIEQSIVEVEEKGEKAVLDAKCCIKDLEQALLKAKQDMALQVRKYQDLMNVKLALDIEISTYKKLLEGEEERIGQDHVVNIQTVPNKSAVPPVKIHQRRRSGPILIKMVETHDTSY